MRRQAGTDRRTLPGTHGTRPRARPPILGSLLVGALAFAPALLAGDLDHGRWDRFVKELVSKEGWVNYRAVKGEWARTLDAYLGELARATVETFESEDARKAFWINAYNALCIRKLLDHELPEKVPNAVFFGKNIFKERTYRIAGKVRSLDDIEHGILRRQFDDNRIHAALVCGASSCPRLRPEAYVADRLDAQLDQECRRWIREGKTLSGERKNRLDREARVYYASRIFDWFEEDFGNSERGIFDFIKRYAGESDREFLQKHRVELEFLDYDWSLNIQPVSVDDGA